MVGTYFKTKSLSDSTLVKYLSLDKDAEKILSSIFDEGLVKVTQPNKLNDILSETKVVGYFNEYSPSDIQLTRQHLIDTNCLNNYEPSIEEIERHLRPFLRRSCASEFKGLQSETDGKDNQTLDREEFERDIITLNDELVRRISDTHGVLSLAQDPFDELMWCHYASNGSGICISFNTKDDYFRQHQHHGVSYKVEDRAHYSNVEGRRRIFGMLVDHEFGLESLIEHLSHSIGFKKFVQSLIFAKSEKWSNEDERRIVYLLSDCILDKETGIYCAKFPFTAFKAIYLGYNINQSVEDKLIKIVKENKKLSNIKLYRVKPSPYSKLVPVEIDA